MDKTIETWIQDNTPDLIKDIHSLVQIPSVSVIQSGEYPYGEGCYKALQQFLSLGGKYNFTTENHGNHCGSIYYGEGERTIGLWGHLDVVPEGGGWIYPPYGTTYQDDFIIGRGAADNKGPSVLGLYALRFFQEQGISLSHRLQVTGGCNEEVGMEDINYYLEHATPPDYSLVLDAGFPVCYGEKGMAEIQLQSSPLVGDFMFSGGDASNKVPEDAQVTLPATPEIWDWANALPQEFTVTAQGDRILVEAKGKSGHVAGPDGTVNAIGLLSAALETLAPLAANQGTLSLLSAITADGYGKGLGIDCADELSGKLTCSGSVLERVDDQLLLTLNIRYPITSKFEDILAILEEKSKAHGYQVKISRNKTPHYVDPKTPWIQTLLRVYQEETGDDTPPYTMGGGTYASKLPNAAAFGPGLPMFSGIQTLPEGHGGAHAPDEAQSIPSFQKALAIYIKAILALDASSPA